MDIFNLQQYLLHNFSREETAEEFGINRPMMEKDIITSIGSEKQEKREGEGSEKTKKFRPKPKNSSR
jgi:hypothetical protein